ncbi:MAG: hypothetical protein SFT91_03975 [Rickettsiaceae bacterium]|nr:hypothetical protein [Rickettsiaceae bacterium]
MPQLFLVIAAGGGNLIVSLLDPGFHGGGIGFRGMIEIKKPSPFEAGFLCAET